MKPYAKHTIVPVAVLVAVALVVGLCHALMIAADGGAARVASPRSGNPVNVSPPPATSRPAYPSPDLAAACRKQADELAGKLGEKFQVIVEAPFVVAGDATSQQLREHLQGSVVRPAEVMWKSYFEARPTKPIVILLFNGQASYKHWAEQLYGDTDVSYFGYCRSDGVMLMDITTGGGTLVHELTHALIAYDFPAVPTWFNEGLGSLHEQCNINADAIVGLTNWRLPALQTALKAGQLRPMAEMISAGDFYGPMKGLNYAQSRYLMQYVQKAGKLPALYRALRDAHATSALPATTTAVNPDVQVVEKVLGKPISDIDADWRKWVMTLRFQ